MSSGETLEHVRAGRASLNLCQRGVLDQVIQEPSHLVNGRLAVVTELDDERFGVFGFKSGGRQVDAQSPSSVRHPDGLI